MPTREQRQKAREREHRRENDADRQRATAARVARGTTGVYDFGLPPVSEAPRGARPIDARGPHAVAMSLNGYYLGLFKREES